MRAERPSEVVSLPASSSHSLAASSAALVAAAYGQNIWVGGGGSSATRRNGRSASDFDGQFNYCRGFYDSNRYEDGGRGGAPIIPAPTTIFPSVSPN